MGSALKAHTLTNDADQRVFLHDVSWREYELLLELRGDTAGPRMTYLEGELEFMSPSRSHESIKKLIARLLETWAFATNTAVNGYGSMTMKNRRKKRGAEPDECYAVGAAKEHPDLAIEVVWTHGGLDKLDVYRGLKVREVWIWRDDALEMYALRGEAYVRIARSHVLPALDVKELLRYVHASDQTAAVRRYFKSLQRKRRV